MSPCTSIYRFLEFEKFVDIVQRQALTFVSPRLWEDPYEAYVYRAISSVDGERRIREILAESAHDADMIMAVLSSMESTIHAQSWTKCGESDALWRIYSGGNKAIRIEIYREDVKHLGVVTAHDVNYFPGKIDLRKELQKMFLEGGGIELGWPLLSKREAFAHEEEVRLLTSCDLSCMHHQQALSAEENVVGKQALMNALQGGVISRATYEEGLKKLEELLGYFPAVAPVRYVGFGHIPGFIKSVLVHPLAPDWHVQTVGTFCEEHQVAFLGKSDLYTLDLDID